MRFNKSKARDVLHAVHEAYVQRKGLYSVVYRDQAPQHRFIPEGMSAGTQPHRRWLYFAVMTDRRQVSTGVYQAHVQLHKHSPWMYDQRVLDEPQEKVHFEVSDKRIGFPNQSAGFWKRCGQTLFEQFDGEPEFLYLFRSIDDLVRWKTRMKQKGSDPLPGFGPKILSLLAMFLEELGMPEVPDALPIDVHIQRFFLAQGLIVLSEPVSNEGMERIIRPFLADLCAERGWKRVDLAHALWLLGNQVCTACSKKMDAPLLCPAYSTCGGSLETRTYFVEGLWYPKAKRFRKGGSRVFKIEGPLFK